MSNQKTLVQDSTMLLESANQALQSTNGQIEFSANQIRSTGKKVRAIAVETIDLLLSYPSQSDIETRKQAVVEQYSEALSTFARNMAIPIKDLNRAWMSVEQNMGFFFLSSGRDSGPDSSELRKLINVMTEAQQLIPETTSDIANLKDAIKASAGGLRGLDDPIDSAISTLTRLSEELEHGYAIFGRQIALAERLHEILVEEEIG